MPLHKVATHKFIGKRFEDHGIDIEVLPDLLRYKTLLVETVKELWRRRHPDRKYLPKNFETGLALKFYTVEPGSAAIPLMCEVAPDAGPQLFDDETCAQLDEAAELIADAVEATANDQPLPGMFPKSIIPLFKDYGSTLREDESIEQLPSKRTKPARYTGDVGLRLAQLVEVPYEDTVDIMGSVTMARVTTPRMEITLEDGRPVEAAFEPAQEETIIEALKQHATAKLRVQGRARFSGSGEIQRVIQVTSLTLVRGEGLPFDMQAKPIWQVFEDIVKAVPDRVIRSLPTDGAELLDHYVYGTPKRKP